MFNVYTDEMPSIERIVVRNDRNRVIKSYEFKAEGGGHFGSLRTSESDRFQPESKPEPCPEPRGTLHIVGFYLRGSALATNKTFSSRRSELFRPTHFQFWFSEGVSAYSINNLKDLGCDGRACALCVYSSQRPSQRQENETKTFSELIRLVSSPKVGPKSIPQLMGAKYQWRESIDVGRVYLNL